MSSDKKISAAELFKDYSPEVMEYDPKVDAQYPKIIKPKNLKVEKSTAQKKSKIEFAKVKNKETAKDHFKNYKAEVLEYDVEVDGSDEFKIRENHLNVKENLLEKIRNAKAKAKANKTTYRQNIRTENEK